MRVTWPKPYLTLIKCPLLIFPFWKFKFNKIMRNNKIFLKVIDTEVRSETQDWCPIVMRLNYVNRNFHPIKSYNWKLKNQQNSEIFLHFRENFVNILIFLHFWVEIKMDSQFLWREKKNRGKLLNHISDSYVF